MKRFNNSGFTLIELIATLVILVLVMGLGTYSITGLITSSKEKDYELLVKEIKNATELYYQECKYVNNNCENEITLKFLVDNGYLKANSSDANNNFMLVNPKDNNDISKCEIGYRYENGKINIWAVNPDESCPTEY